MAFAAGHHKPQELAAAVEMLLGPVRAGYTSVSLSSLVAVRKGKTFVVGAAARFTSDGEASPPVDVDLPEGLSFRQMTVGVAEAEGLILQLALGELPSPWVKTPVGFDVQQWSTSKADDGFGTSFPANVCFGTLTTELRGIHLDSQAIRVHLLSSRAPHRTLGEFLVSSCGIDLARDQHSISLVFPIEMQITPRVLERTAGVDIRVPKGLALEHGWVSFVGPGIRAGVPFSEMKQKPHSRKPTVRLSARVRPRKGAVSASVLFGGREIWSDVIGLPSSRLLAHEVFDRQFERLNAQVFEDKRGSKAEVSQFEEGVGAILHIAGASVHHVGRKGKGQPQAPFAPDLLLFHPDWSLGPVLVECCVELPDDEHVKRLVTRGQELADAAGLTAGVIALRVPAEHIPESLRDSSRELGITIVSTTELQEVLRRCLNGEPSRLVDLLLHPTTTDRLRSRRFFTPRRRES